MVLASKATLLKGLLQLALAEPPARSCSVSLYISLGLCLVKLELRHLEHPVPVLLPCIILCSSACNENTNEDLLQLRCVVTSNLPVNCPPSWA